MMRCLVFTTVAVMALSPTTRGADDNPRAAMRNLIRAHEACRVQYENTPNDAAKLKARLDTLSDRAKEYARLRADARPTEPAPGVKKVVVPPATASDEKPPVKGGHADPVRKQPVPPIHYGPNTLLDPARVLESLTAFDRHRAAAYAALGGPNKVDHAALREALEQLGKVIDELDDLSRGVADRPNGRPDSPRPAVAPTAPLPPD